MRKCPISKRVANDARSSARKRVERLLENLSRKKRAKKNHPRRRWLVSICGASIKLPADYGFGGRRVATSLRIGPPSQN